MMVLYGEELLSSLLTHKPHTGGPHLVSCPQLIIPYIQSYLPYLEMALIQNSRPKIIYQGS
jgi:hypothetical protein